MEFTIPTTKEEMYATLREINKYYRIRIPSYEPEELPVLNLEKIECVEKTDEEISLLAKQQLEFEQAKEILEYKENLEMEIAKLQTELSQLTVSYENIYKSIDESFEKSKKNIETESVKKGIYASSIVLDKISELEISKNEHIIKSKQELSEKIALINADISAKNLLLEQADSKFRALYDLRVVAKTYEIKNEQDKIYREIFRYNNTIYEKEQRNACDHIKSNASLQLKYLEIRSKEFSRAELIEMGYYGDVVNCVCSYYNSLPAEDAYSDILNEGKIAVYLDDYYQQILFLYQTKANG